MKSTKSVKISKEEFHKDCEKVMKFVVKGVADSSFELKRWKSGKSFIFAYATNKVKQDDLIVILKDFAKMDKKGSLTLSEIPFIKKMAEKYGILENDKVESRKIDKKSAPKRPKTSVSGKKTSTAPEPKVKTKKKSDVTSNTEVKPRRKKALIAKAVTVSEASIETVKDDAKEAAKVDNKIIEGLSDLEAVKKIENEIAGKAWEQGEHPPKPSLIFEEKTKAD